VFAVNMAALLSTIERRSNVWMMWHIKAISHPKHRIACNRARDDADPLIFA
jgi:hypothetical protein